MSSTTPDQSIGIFYKARVRDVANGDPVTRGPGASVREVALSMHERAVGSVIIVDEQDRVLGIVTERDLVHKVVAGGEAEQNAADIMTSPAVSVAPEDFVYEAVQLMLRRRCRRLVVVDASGRVAGLLSMPDLLRLQNLETRTLSAQVAKAGSLEELKSLRPHIDELAERLLLDDVDPVVLGHLLTDFGDAVTRRLLLLTEARLRTEGRDRPRQRYAWVVFGSNGRQEQPLRGDQDNGIILADGTTAEARAYYRELASRVNQALADYGFELCGGGVMAREDAYFGTLSEWKERVAVLVSGAHQGRALRDLSIVLDGRAVAGRTELVDQLWDHLLRALHASGAARRALAEDATTKDVPLALWGRFRFEKTADGRRGVDVKRGGSLPLTAAVKAFASDRGLRETSTPARIRSLRDLGLFDREPAGELLLAHGLFLRLRLQASLEAASRRHAGSHFVYPQEWSERERQDLRRAFKAIEHLQALLRFHFVL